MPRFRIFYRQSLLPTHILSFPYANYIAFVLHRMPSLLSSTPKVIDWQSHYSVGNEVSTVQTGNATHGIPAEVHACTYMPYALSASSHSLVSLARRHRRRPFCVKRGACACVSVRLTEFVGGAWRVGDTGQSSSWMFVVKGEEKGGRMGYIMHDAAPDMGCHVLCYSGCTQAYQYIVDKGIAYSETARMYIPIHPAQPEALRRRVPTIGYMQTYTIRKQADISIISKILRSIARILKREDPVLHRRSSSAAHTNLIIGLVVGFTLAAFIIGVCIFICCYGDSIRFSKKKRGHRRRSTSSKGPRNPKAREAEHAEGAPEGA
ncbi:hypothetical protein HDV57DRAFT_2999 [Trichoderma longibrachiatum]